LKEKRSLTKNFHCPLSVGISNATLLTAGPWHHGDQIEVGEYMRCSSWRISKAAFLQATLREIHVKAMKSNAFPFGI